MIYETSRFLKGLEMPEASPAFKKECLKIVAMLFIPDTTLRVRKSKIANAEGGRIEKAEALR